MPKPGHAVWKVFSDDNRVFYFNSNKSFLRYYFKFGRTYVWNIYYRTLEGWKFGANTTIQTECICGRYFTDSMNGEEFRCRKFLPINTMIEIIEYIRSPELCQRCFYYEEWQNKRWCPKYYKQIFES